MKISYNWLKDYVDVKMAAEELAQTLTMAGLTVESLESKGGDSILEIEVTANRPDWLSYIGVAREIAALTGAKLKIPKPAIDHRSKTIDQRPIRITVEDKRLCPRYTARVIRGVKVASSPAWLVKRIESMGLRPVNNIVDITNFCLFETGEPMHAFDLSKIKDAISVRRSSKGEKIRTIDGIERTLDGSSLVIADASGPIAAAGVMGGLATEVTEGTKDILLEAASFDPVATRRAVRSLGAATESSYRFERRVDPENIVFSSDRAASLITELAGGRIEEFVDIRLASGKERSAVKLSFSHVNALLGIEIPPARIKAILTTLGLKAKSAKKDSATFVIPAFRNDLKVEEDLIEEVARIYGYDKIKLTVPAVVDQGERMPKDFLCQKRVRASLAGAGFNEIMTYSFLPRGSVEAAGLSQENLAEVRNPLSSEQEVMRPSLMPGMLNALLWNINRRAQDLKLFEIGNIYFKESGDKFSEKRCLCMAMTGTIHSGWDGRSRTAWFADLMGAFDEVLHALGMNESAYSVKMSRDVRFSPAASATLYIGESVIGAVGQASAKILKNFDVKEEALICEVSLDEIFKHARLAKRFAGLPRYPSVSRDISIIVDEGVSNADLVSVMHQAASAILKEVRLIDRYSGKQIPDGKIGLTYRLEYQNPSKTLEEKEISDIHAGILRSLEEKFGAHLR